MLLVGVYNDVDSLENSLAVPQNVKHRVTVLFNKSIPKYIPKRNKRCQCKTFAQVFIAPLLNNLFALLSA